MRTAGSARTVKPGMRVWTERTRTDSDGHRPLSDILIRDLTAHRTLGLRLALSEQPEVAIVAVTHALSAQIFYRGADAHVLDIRPVSAVLASHADGIEDTKAGRAWADHHARWAAQMPRDVSELWTFVVELDHDSRMALFAHCVALTANAVRLPSERRPRAVATADRLAEAVSLDMTAHWYRPRGPISVVSPSRIFLPLCGKASAKKRLAGWRT